MTPADTIRRWLTIARFRVVQVEHLRYVKTPAPDRLSKPLEMARNMGRDDLVKRLEALSGAR